MTIWFAGRWHLPRGGAAAPFLASLVASIVTLVVIHQGSVRALDLSGQATKGVWGMSRRQKAMKGVEVCDKPGGVDKRALIPGSLNEPMLNP